MQCCKGGSGRGREGPGGVRNRSGTVTWKRHVKRPTGRRRAFQGGQQHETRQRGETAEGLKAAMSSMVLVEHAVQDRSGW